MSTQPPVHAKLRMEPLWVRVDSNRAKLTMFVMLFVAGSAFLLASALVAVPGCLIGLAGWFIEALDAPDYFRGLAIAFGVSLAALLGAGSLAAAVQLSNAEDWVRLPLLRFGPAAGHSAILGARSQ
ncbi:MAG: hypothetical protein Q8K99_12910 [Actinomycetota bacterium]|nr:hypothetical protein [Actinomycetota bacterium]